MGREASPIPIMFEKFSEKSKRAIIYAREEYDKRGGE